MSNVNWVKSDEYHEVQSQVLLACYTELWNSNKEILIHDPEVSNDQPDEYLRVLDDSSEIEWIEFFRYSTNEENHKGWRKEQKDGTTLMCIREAYPRATELPPLYFLIKR